MRDRIARLFAYLTSNTGRCPTCMKTAFLAAAMSWPAALALGALWSGASLGTIMLLPLALTALWGLHLVVYTRRLWRLLWAEYRPAPAAGVSAGRRQALRIGLMSVGLGLAGAVWLPGAARAGSPCGTGKSCPNSAPNCCSRSQGKCCSGNWACWHLGRCFAAHADARKACGQKGNVVACS